MADPKKAGEQADRLITQLNQAAAAEAPASTEDQGVPAAAIPDEGSAPTPPDVGDQASQTPSVSPELEALRKEIATANQRWNVLQGMVNKKDSEIEQMRLLLAQLSRKTEEKPQDASPAQAKNVTAQEVEEFGQDLIDLITKIAMSTVTAAMPQINARVDEVQKSLKDVSDHTARTSEDLFFEALSKRVPEWEVINVDPEFIQSLQEVDDYSGARLIDLLKDAYSRMDLNRTAKFFEKFKGRVVQAPAVAAPAAERPDVTKLVTPGKSKATPAAQAPEARVWTSIAISKLYEDRHAGRITQEEFAKQERDLFKAQGENRFAA